MIPNAKVLPSSPSPASVDDKILRPNQKVFLANGSEVWVMDSTVASIEYSFDQKQWKPVSNFVKTVVLGRGSIADSRLDPKATVYVRYTDDQGNRSLVYKLSAASAIPNKFQKTLGQPIDPSRFNVPSELLRGAKPSGAKGVNYHESLQKMQRELGCNKIPMSAFIPRRIVDQAILSPGKRLRGHRQYSSPLGYLLANVLKTTRQIVNNL